MRRPSLVLLLALALTACRRHAPAPEAASSAPSPVKILYPAAPGSFVKLLERLSPSVVQLSAQSPVKGGPADWLPSLPGTDPLPGGDQGERMRRSLGTGFLVDGEGSILTNVHLLGKEREVRARFAGGLELAAKLIGQDPGSDLAVLRVEVPAGSRLVPLRLGDSDQLQVGEWVVAIGNPFGEGLTASAGVVSARERRDLSLAGQGTQGFLQTDASIHPGNSGGPLVNVVGEVVGINTAVALETHAVGLALPIKQAQRLLPALKRDGRVVRAWVGIYMDRATPEQARAAGLKSASGAIVRTVVPRGPAERAGLRAGDLIVSFDGREVTDAGELPWRVSLAGVGRPVPVTVWRSGKNQTFTLRTERMPE